MRAVDIIRKKRQGGELSREEMLFLIRGYCATTIPDYQMSAFLMAVTFRGMSQGEMASMTEEMMRSGEVLDLGFLAGMKVDKHSTGGVGDKTSLIVAPSVAAAGLIVPMIAGRGLAHTGGTLDKLESIPGFNVRLTSEKFKETLARANVALIGQTDRLAPADRKLYALRDVTGTVDCQPLIAASIMSKKLAEGIDALVLDVKTGSGAFMKGQQEAEELARAMVGIGQSCGKKLAALITDMNQPLGELVGNSLEVVECIEVLKGRGSRDVVALSEELSAHCFVLGGAVENLEQGRELFRKMIRSGQALAKFEQIVLLQDGNPAVIEDYSLLPRARHESPLLATETGYVQFMDTEKIGLAMSMLGAGRETVDSQIDHAVGMRVDKKIGDAVEDGEALCTVFYNDEARFQEAVKRLRESYKLSPEPPQRPTLIKKVIG